VGGAVFKEAFFKLQVGQAVDILAGSLASQFLLRSCCTARFWQLPTSPTPLKI